MCLDAERRKTSETQQIATPAMVGFKLKQGITPNGDRCFYPSIFVGNSEDMSVNIEYLISWIGG